MKIAAIAMVAMGLAGCATSPTQQSEIGYAKGTLAYRALMKHDWAKAEAQLADTSQIDADDPARLLNLGQLYMSTDRNSEARDAFVRVLDGEDMQLVLSDGRVVTAHALAKSRLSAPMTASK
jgi:Tfp pilus assembly protein PilF